MRARTSQITRKNGRFLSTLVGLSALLLVSSACQFGGSFEETRCDTQADCAGEAICVEGFCALPNEIDPIPDTGYEDTEHEDVGDPDGGPIVGDDAGDIDETDGFGDREIVEITLTPASLTLQVGETASLLPAILDDAGDELEGYGPEEFSWSSDAPGVAFVSGSGEVRALASGDATITVGFGALSATAEVTVNAADAAEIEIFPATMTLTEGSGFQAQARAYDVNGQRIEDPELDWSTDDATVATVDGDGAISAVGAGSATLTVAIRDMPSVSATSSISVNAAIPASALLSPAQATITVGQTVQFEVYDDDLNKVDASMITWASATPAIATIDTTGEVTGVSNGTVAITADVPGVSQPLTADVIVEARQVARVEIADRLYELEIGEQVTATANAFAADGTDITGDVSFAWTVLDTGIALNGGSGNITGVSAGATVLEASAGGVSGYAGIVVARHPVETVEVTPASSTLEIGETVDLSLALKGPGGVAIPSAERIVSWSSNKENIAVVDGNGRVTAISDGSATITATSEGVSDSVSITVSPETPVNLVPVAFPQDVTILADTSLTFNLAAYDPEGQPLTYELVSSMPGVEGTVSLDDATLGIVTYEPPPSAFSGPTSFQFKVTDDAGNPSGNAKVTITFVAGNTPPTAEAGTDQSGDTCDTFALNGVGDDGSETPEPDLDYQWAVVREPAAGHTLDNPTTADAELSDTSEGVYILTLTVTDADGASATDFLVIEVAAGADPCP